ncbi:hypothetical protein C8J57DRAFT_1232508 [Mycena rebaudengoi]|nr:hypothetical protein C8J57DRAFT_1232508 [Mycena rebaudengoi]
MSNSRKVRSKRKADQLADTNHITFANPTVKTQGLSTSTIPELAIPPRTKEKTQTQNAQLLDDFVEHFEELGRLLLEYEADEMAINCHAKYALLKLTSEIRSIGLKSGTLHNGNHCPSPCGERLFTVVDDNGIHSTRLAFCGCHELPPNKIKQLMQARLFPASTHEPQTAFTINMLKCFQLHNLESKKAAYDYLGAIRRLTDNSFTADVPNPYAAFLGNLIVWCPACPEPGFNSGPYFSKTPHHLRHLNQSQRTLDGNFQCNQFTKITDPDDVSLCAGKGYFPLDSEYREYLTRVPVSKEKSTCNYLKAVNKQDKKKFKNMAITGTVNCQCSHVFILSCVDLYHGERLFANSDMALAMDLKQHQPNESFQVKLQLEVDDIDEVSTYDIASYMECVGHFHGETAEQYWPEANQLGPHVRQMNNGHRQDTMINHHGDWNHKKTMNMEDIAEAKVKYVEKWNHFIGLSVSFHDRVKKWKEMPRTSTKKGKEAVSVYKHNSTKGMLSTFHRTTFRDLIGSYTTVPSQLAIYQKMLSDESAFASTKIPKSKVARFLDEGFKIQDAQYVSSINQLDQS